MNRAARTKLRKDWEKMYNLKAEISTDLDNVRVEKVARLKASGKGDPGFPLFAAFDNDVQRCVSGRITPEQALTRLEKHLKAWEAGDPRYQ